MQVQTVMPDTTSAINTTNQVSIVDADGFQRIRFTASEPSDADVLSVLCDLFAGRAATAFGESLEWWAETFQCDLAAKAAGGVVLDPFMGSGSTGKAAILDGFRFVGCELQAEYIEIARARIQHAVAVEQHQYELEIA